MMSEEADRLVENEITRGQHHRSKQKAKAARRKGRDIQIKELTAKLDKVKKILKDGMYYDPYDLYGCVEEALTEWETQDEA